MIPINYYQIIIIIFKSQVNKHFFLAYKNKIQRYIYIIYSLCILDSKSNAQL